MFHKWGGETKINLVLEYKTFFFTRPSKVTTKPNHEKKMVESKALCLMLTL